MTTNGCFTPVCRLGAGAGNIGVGARSVRIKKGRSPLPEYWESGLEARYVVEVPFYTRSVSGVLQVPQRAVITASLVIPAFSMEAMALATWP